MTRADAAEVDGVLFLDKPAGPTSHDMVAATRRALRTRRIGHTGTLDPFASGLLLLCVGHATRVAEYLSGLDKRYRAQVRLGRTTDTDDSTGTVLAERDASGVTHAQLDAVLRSLRGTVLQRPPAYSAKKRGGERAYAAARAGRTLELEAVPVRIDELTVTRYEPPLLELDIACGSGTYIRAIARDLGEALGVGAHLTALRRTAVGPHEIGDALPATALEEPDRVRQALVSVARALAHLPQMTLDTVQREHIRHGRAFRSDAAPDADVVMLLHDGRLVAIAECRDGTVQPRKVVG